MTIETLPITKIEASKQNPRKRFDESSIAGLAQSIKTDGLLQNLTVGKPSGKKKKYPLICGERRFRAIKLLIENGDLPNDFEVPVEVKADLSDEETLRIATIENVQRENLSPLEEAKALSMLVKEGEKLDDIVCETGLAVATIRRRLMLLNLSEEARTSLEEGEITLSQAEALSLGSFEQQDKLLRNAINGWVDAEDIRERLLGDLPTLSMAIFDKEQYTGDYTSDLLAEDDATYFNDVEQFMELQKAAAENLVEAYSKTADWSELVEGYFSPWQYTKASEGETGGVVVALRHSGEVEIHEGLIRTKADTGTVKTLNSRAKDTYPAPLRKYIAMHKSVAVQAALLDNHRKLKELAVATRLYRATSHESLSYFGREEKTNPPALQIVNAAARKVLSYFGEVPGDASYKDLCGMFSYSLSEAYQAVQSLSDEQLEAVLLTLQALEFGQLTCERLDTDSGSIFNLIAKDISVDMRDYWRPDEGFLRRRNKAQLQQIIKDSGCSLKFGNAASYKKKDLVSQMAEYFCYVLSLEAPNEHELKATFWIPEAMQFPAVNPDAVTEETDEPEQDIGMAEEEEYLEAA